MIAPLIANPADVAAGDTGGDTAIEQTVDDSDGEDEIVVTEEADDAEANATDESEDAEADATEEASATEESE